MGPGEVNLLTGNFTVSATDAAVAAAAGGLALARSYNSRESSVVDAMFGPGWRSSVAPTHAPYTGLTVVGSLVQAGLPDGGVVGFTQLSAIGTEATFAPPVGHEDLQLAYDGSLDVYTLTSDAETAVRFGRPTDTPAGQYVPVELTAGSGEVTRISWERTVVDDLVLMRPTQMLAPAPGGIDCSETLVKGCRALRFSYAGATTATGDQPEQWDDYAGRVTSVSFTGFDPQTNAMSTVVMTRYAYDSAGRLRASWDPRLDWSDVPGSPSGGHHLLTSYDYEAAGVLSGITPPGQEPWHFTYTATPEDAGVGRLASVSRTALEAGTATGTVVYSVPIAGAGAPYDLSAARTTRWGQTRQPVDATAVFPPNQVPARDQAGGVLPESYERATITYIDPNGRAVNTVEPGGYTDAVWYDQWGNVVRSITPGNLHRALEDSSTDTPADEAQAAADLSTVDVYSADGQRLLGSFGPEHDVSLPSGLVVRGRAHSSFQYDEGKPADSELFDLVTTETMAVRYQESGVEVDADARTNTIQYDWESGRPTRVTVDPTGLQLISTTAYDGEGRVIERTTPGAQGAAGTPHTMRTTYYTAGTHEAHAQCGSRPEWIGLACRVETLGDSPASAPLTVKEFTYDLYQQTRTVVEATRDGDRLLRTTTMTYDGAGRPYEIASTMPDSGSEPLPTQRHVYDQATGDLVRTQSLDSNGTVTAEIIRRYDTLGRQTSYTDADGNTSTTTYDQLSRPVTFHDGKGTQTYTYDGGTERRGLPTTLVDSHAGTYTASYDPDGTPVSQTWPNGISTTVTNDEAGNETAISYVQSGCAGDDCTLFSDAADMSIHAQRRVVASTLSEQSFGYDSVGRLTRVIDTAGGECSTRVHTYNAATNRTSMTSYAPDANGGCQNAVGNQRTWTYDSADRITTAGTAYDDLGRTITVAAADTASNTAVSTRYFVNDMVRQLQQGSAITTYSLDPLTNRIRTTQSGEATRINHYASDGDSPVWTSEGTSFTRVLGGIVGVAGTYTSEGGQIQWQIANLRGHFVASVLDGTLGIAATYETDEFGQRNTGAAQRRYTWQGSALRAADNPGDLVIMGVRLYNPSTGRFLSQDPVYGGNANSYEYCAGDSVNCSDTSGAKASCTGTQLISRSTYKTWTTWAGVKVKRWTHTHKARVHCVLNTNDAWQFVDALDELRNTAIAIGLSVLAAGWCSAFEKSALAATCGIVAFYITTLVLAKLSDKYKSWYKNSCPGRGMTITSNNWRYTGRETRTWWGTTTSTWDTKWLTDIKFACRW
jgi:RHS repeat-associated protein